ncbi:hypothetical protein CLOSTMETH_03426 [[Clostridium] methylpentosum DSM 5476]|uniref:Uncharacterized protein n=1 Tax=[Clostridium] methylpentosum DSM 5476 TaxID=537013 RepID=C0EHT1_9FIRM|nr:hypothetical protein CLOSTMETH_03426 [[Clostridium] methylpentosum DSM 5476]
MQAKEAGMGWRGNRHSPAGKETVKQCLPKSARSLQRVQSAKSSPGIQYRMAEPP